MNKRALVRALGGAAKNIAKVIEHAVNNRFLSHQLTMFHHGSMGGTSFDAHFGRSSYANTTVDFGLDRKDGNGNPIRPPSRVSHMKVGQSRSKTDADQILADIDED